MQKYFLIFTLAFSCLAHAKVSADVSRPGERGEPTQVFVTVFVIDLDDIDTADQNFTANVGMRVTWRDERLASIST